MVETLGVVRRVVLFASLATLAAASLAVPAVAGAHVYWAHQASGTIGRANLDGTSPDQSFITGANDPIGVTVDGSYVYWTNYASGTIGRASLDGTSPDQNFITGASDPTGVAVDGSYVYWTNSASR
jgi:virginiamycin B lyase